MQTRFRKKAKLFDIGITAVAGMSKSPSVHFSGGGGLVISEILCNFATGKSDLFNVTRRRFLSDEKDIICMDAAPQPWQHVMDRASNGSEQLFF